MGIHLKCAAWAAAVWGVSATGAWAQELEAERLAAAAKLTPEQANAAAAQAALETLHAQSQMEILTGLGVLIVVMVLVGAAMLLRLQHDAKEIATTDAAKTRYYELPFGVPEGTVRGLVSLLIIIIGLAVLIVQEPLGIESSEAIAGFVSAVIAFYFVTRQTADNNNNLRNGANALNAAVRTVQGLRVAPPPSTVKPRGAGLKSVALREMMMDAAGSISHFELQQLIYDETAAVLNPEDPSRFDPNRPIARGDNNEGYGYDYDRLCLDIDRIVASAKTKQPLQPFADVVDVEAGPVARKALKGDAGDLVNGIVAAIEKDLRAAGVEILP